MAETRTPRDLVSREKTARPVYVPPSALPDPTPEPDPVSNPAPLVSTSRKLRGQLALY